jgi:hypothetical protein
LATHNSHKEFVMRVSSATRAALLLAMLTLVGCSSMPSVPKFWDKLSFKSKKPSAAASTSALAAAPPAAPGFHANTAAPPQVSMPSAAPASGSLPVYPGTNYPVTPYPGTPAAASVAAAPAGYGTGEVTPASGYAAAANPYVAPPGAAAAGAYAAPPAPYYAPPTGYSAAAPQTTTTR